MSGLIVQTGSKAVGAAQYKPVTTQNVVKWLPSCCLVCHSWCAIAVGMDAYGHVRKIEGQGGQPATFDSGATVKTHPLAGCTKAGVGNGRQWKFEDANHTPTPAGYLAYSMHNKGRICAKGTDGMEHLYDPDSVKYPLERTAGRGDGKWRKVSWNYALRKIANVMRELAGCTTFYDLNDADNTDGSEYALDTYNNVVDSGLLNAPRSKDYRHRFLHWVGRAEGSPVGAFTASYGSPNHVEHTALCELSRHYAGRTLWGHHWSSYDLTVKRAVNIARPSGANRPAGDINLDSNLHDCDMYIEWGGNPCEQKIPHATIANHIGDRRRRNLQGFSHAVRTANSSATYGRILCVEVRQSNTAAVADEQFLITPGSDGALALGIMYYIFTTKTAATLRAELDRGHMGTPSGLTGAGADYSRRRYYGMFTAEETGGVASGSTATAVPAGKSLESYLMGGGFQGHVNAALNTWASVGAKVATLTGLTATDIEYLGQAIGGFGANGTFLNCIIDIYRGPVKHSNGAYNGVAIRSLQVLAANYSAVQYWTNAGATATEPVVINARGGYNAPAAFNSDGDWQGGGSGGGIPGLSGSYVGGINSVSPALPAAADVNFTATVSNRQQIDKWDYARGVARYRGAFKWTDQNTSPGVRFSLGLHPYQNGMPKPAGVAGPYDSIDPTFQIEALLQHQNAITYGRPNSLGEIEMLTKKDAGGNYLLKHFFSIDPFMGDATRLADVILPDGTYLERWESRSGEGAEFNWRGSNMFNRQPVYQVDGPTVNGVKVPRHMFDRRQHKAIFYELTRYIEPSTSGAAAGTTFPSGLAPTGWTGWNGALYTKWTWCKADGTSLGGEAGPLVDQNSLDANRTASARYINDGEYAVLRDEHKQGTGIQAHAEAAGATLGANNAGYDYIRHQGYIWNTDDGPAYWRYTYDAAGEGSQPGKYYVAGCRFKVNGGAADTGVGNKLTVYNERMDSVPDMIVGGNYVGTHATDASNSDPAATGTQQATFYGHAVYRPVVQHNNAHTSPTYQTDYPLYLTTYKVNVHTQSRTASCPRLNEILGNSWVVIHPSTAASNGGIQNGDKVRVSTELGYMDGEAKVTQKAQPGCVHISHSQGHRAGLTSFEADGNPYHAAFGEYLVSEDGGVSFKKNRVQSNALNNPSPTPLDSYRLGVPPSAPGNGVHPNTVINQNTAHNAGDGVFSELSMDPVGGSMAWYDSKCKIQKL